MQEKSKKNAILLQYNLHTAVHLAMFLAIIGYDRVPFSASFDGDPAGCNTPLYHLTFHFHTPSFGQDLIRTVGTYIVGMTDDTDALVRPGNEELIEFIESRFGRIQDTRFSRSEIDIMENEGFDFFRRHDHTGEKGRISDGVAEGEIIECGRFDRIEGHAVIEQDSEHRMDGVGSGLQHFMMIGIAHDDVRHYRAGSEGVGDGKGDTQFRIEKEFNGVFIIAMGEEERIGREIPGLGGYCPVIADRESFGYARTLGVGRFADLGFSIRPCVLFLNGDMGRRKEPACFEVIGIDIEKRFSVFDTLPFGCLEFRRLFLLRFSLGCLAFPFGLCLGFRPFLCRRHGVRVHISDEQGEQDEYYGGEMFHYVIKINRRVVTGLSSCRGPTWA